MPNPYLYQKTVLEKNKRSSSNDLEDGLYIFPDDSLVHIVQGKQVPIGGGGGAGFEIFELHYNQDTDQKLPEGSVRVAVFNTKQSMIEYFEKFADELDRLKDTNKVCEIGTYDSSGKPLTINNEAYKYVSSSSEKWIDVVGGLIGPPGDSIDPAEGFQLQKDKTIYGTSADNSPTHLISFDEINGHLNLGDIDSNKTDIIASVKSGMYIKHPSRGTLKLLTDGDEGVKTIVAGDNITVDNKDPFNPIISSSGSGGGLPDHGPLGNLSTPFYELEAGKYYLTSWENGSELPLWDPSSDRVAIFINYGGFYTETNGQRCILATHNSAHGTLENVKSGGTWSGWRRLDNTASPALPIIETDNPLTYKDPQTQQVHDVAHVDNGGILRLGTTQNGKDLVIESATGNVNVYGPGTPDTGKPLAYKDELKDPADGFELNDSASVTLSNTSTISAKNSNSSTEVIIDHNDSSLNVGSTNKHFNVKSSDRPSVGGENVAYLSDISKLEGTGVKFHWVLQDAKGSIDVGDHVMEINGEYSTASDFLIYSWDGNEIVSSIPLSVVQSSSDNFVIPNDTRLSISKSGTTYTLHVNGSISNIGTIGFTVGYNSLITAGGAIDPADGFTLKQGKYIGLIDNGSSQQVVLEAASNAPNFLLGSSDLSAILNTSDHVYVSGPGGVKKLLEEGDIPDNPSESKAHPSRRNDVQLGSADPYVVPETDLYEWVTYVGRYAPGEVNHIVNIQLPAKSVFEQYFWFDGINDQEKDKLPPATDYIFSIGYEATAKGIRLTSTDGSISVYGENDIVSKIENRIFTFQWVKYQNGNWNMAFTEYDPKAWVPFTQVSTAYSGTPENQNLLFVEGKGYVQFDRQVPVETTDNETGKFKLIRINSSETESSIPKVKLGVPPETCSGFSYIEDGSDTKPQGSDILQIASGTYTFQEVGFSNVMPASVGDNIYVTKDGSVTLDKTPYRCGWVVDNGVILDIDMYNASAISDATGHGDFEGSYVTKAAESLSGNRAVVQGDAGSCRRFYYDYAHALNGIALENVTTSEDVTVAVRGIFPTGDLTIGDPTVGDLIVVDRATGKLQWPSLSAANSMNVGWYAGNNEMWIDVDMFNRYRDIERYGPDGSLPEDPTFNSVTTSAVINPNNSTSRMEFSGNNTTQKSAGEYDVQASRIIHSIGETEKMVISSASVVVKSLLDLNSNSVKNIGDAENDNDVASWGQIKKYFDDNKVDTDLTKRVSDLENALSSLQGTVTTLQGTVSSLQSSNNLTFNDQKLTYANDILESSLTRVDGTKQVNQVTIKASPDGPVVPDNFTVYFGWSDSNNVSGEDFASPNASLGQTSKGSSKSTLLSDSFDTSRSGSDWKFSYIAYPKGAVEPDPMKVEYIQGQPASWQAHETTVGELPYIVLQPEFANNVETISMKLSQ